MVASHPGPEPPQGRPHGATAVWVDADGLVVLISPDGVCWGLPGGRPEGDESWEATMRRCTERTGRMVDLYLFLAATFVVVRCLIQRACTRYRWPGQPTTRLLK